MTDGTLQNQDHKLSTVFTREQRAKNIDLAMEQHRAEGRAVDENTARLRALRLARDAAAKDAEAKPAKRAAKKMKRVVV